MKIKNFLGSYAIAQSLYNGDDIFTVINYESRNSKTGNVFQLSFIPVGMFTEQGFDKSSDDAVCPTDCFFKDSNACYVNLAYAPRAIVQSIRNGNYQDKINYLKLSQNVLRLGSYGDCSCLPYEFIEKIVKAAKQGYLNYTHGWKTCDSRFANIAMASVESIADKELANAMGYRTFRVRPIDGEILEDELLCPYEKNNFITCKMCMKCNGNNGKSKKNIVVTVHGTANKVNTYQHFSLKQA